MATKAEQARVLAERESSEKHRAKREAKRARAARKPRPKSHESSHAGKKATYAFEEHTAEARPSRKSSRKGANRLKADANLNFREELTKGSTEARAVRGEAKGRRVRGR